MSNTTCSHSSIAATLLTATVACVASTAHAQNTTFIRFASVGQSYSAAIFGSDPRVGRQVISATITLHLTVAAGSNAAEFLTDLLLPVDSGGIVIISGADQHWTGSGDFTFQTTTTDYNGVFIARRYGAETFGVQGSLSSDSGITLTFAPICLPDFNHDSIVDFFDYLDFVQAFEDLDPSADFNNDAAIDFFDYLDFVQTFTAGC